MHVTPRRLRILSLSCVLSCLAFSGASASWLWIQSDWSGGAYESAASLDPEVEPGELVLENDGDRFIVAFDATDFPGIWALEVWRGRLYMAAGDLPMHIDDADIMIYDYATDSFWIDYPVNEQGLCVFEVFDDVIYSPGPDNMGTHDFGNLYYNEGDGWVRKETIPLAVHVEDVTKWDGKIWVTTGTAILPDFPGVLYSSTDMGDSWETELVLHAEDPVEFRRLYGLNVWGGSLWVQTDWKSPEGKVIFELTGEDIISHTVEASGDECQAGFTEFQGEMVVVTRTIVDYYDGNSWSFVILPAWSHNWVCEAVIVYKDRLYVGGYEGLHYTEDKVNFSPVDVTPLAGREFEGLARYHGRLYGGSVYSGDVYVTPAALSGSLVSEPHAFPAAVCEGTVSWTALIPSAGTTLAFQLRSATSEALLAGAPFLGPDGTGNSWYLSSGDSLPAAHCGHRWFQYRVNMETDDERLAPVLQEFVLEVDNSGTGLPGDAWPGAQLSVWPNPFRTQLRLSLTGDVEGRLRIFDVRGRCVRDMGSVAGSETLIWDGRDESGSPLSAGVYLVRYESADGEGMNERVVHLR